MTECLTHLAVSPELKGSVLYTQNPLLPSQVETLQVSSSDLSLIVTDQGQIVDLNAGIYSLWQSHSSLLRVRFRQKHFFIQNKSDKRENDRSETRLLLPQRMFPY